MTLISYGLYPMVEQAPALTETPPGSTASLGPCSCEHLWSCAKGTLCFGRAWSSLSSPEDNWHTGSAVASVEWEDSRGTCTWVEWLQCFQGQQANNPVFMIFNIQLQIQRSMRENMKERKEGYGMTGRSTEKLKRRICSHHCGYP